MSPLAPLAMGPSVGHMGSSTVRINTLLNIHVRMTHATSLTLRKRRKYVPYSSHHGYRLACASCTPDNKMKRLRLAPETELSPSMLSWLSPTRSKSSRTPLPASAPHAYLRAWRHLSSPGLDLVEGELKSRTRSSSGSTLKDGACFWRRRPCVRVCVCAPVCVPWPLTLAIVEGRHLSAASVCPSACAVVRASWDR